LADEQQGTGWPSAFQSAATVRRPGAWHCFELGKSLLDRVQVRTVRRQVEQHGAARLDHLTNTGDVVRVEPVYDRDITASLRGDQDLLDISKDGLAADLARSARHSPTPGASPTAMRAALRPWSHSVPPSATWGRIAVKNGADFGGL
jgi:hypothetical protein